MSAARQARRSAAGFTLVELMVALTGGLFISLAVFALARDSGRFYQREARLANATISGLLGFERLRTDIARAGFLSSPNINRDVRVCGAPQPTWPNNLRNLASIQIGAGIVYPLLTANGRTPPSILLSGAFTNSDMFSATNTGVGATTTFYLTASQPALLRLGGGANPTTAAMTDAFPNGRGLHIVEYGRTYYGQIVGAVGGAAPTVTINATPLVQSWDGSGIGCGLHPIGSATGRATINVINFIQYDIRNLSTNAQTPQALATYAGLYNVSQRGAGESQRTELVRVEQDVSGNAIPGTEEIVAEYAVDLDLALHAVTAVVGTTDPQVSTIASGAANFGIFTGPTFGTANTPELIRSVRVRLGVRSREADRDFNIPNPLGTGIFRFNVGVGSAGTLDSFARVRTFQADVALHNQADILW